MKGKKQNSAEKTWGEMGVVCRVEMVEMNEDDGCFGFNRDGCDAIGWMIPIRPGITCTMRGGKCSFRAREKERRQRKCTHIPVLHHPAFITWESLAYLLARIYIKIQNVQHI